MRSWWLPRFLRSPGRHAFDSAQSGTASVVLPFPGWSSRSGQPDSQRPNGSRAVGADDRRTALTVSTDLAARRLKLTGDLDFFSPSLTEVSATLMVINPGDTTVDLAGVRFIDAGGLGRLVRLRNNLARHKATLTVINASTGAQRIFRIAGLQDMLPRGTPTVDAIGNGDHVASGSDQVARMPAKHSEEKPAHGLA